MGFVRIARTFQDRIAQYVRLIYRVRSSHQDARTHQMVCKQQTQETTMSTNTKIALAAALFLGAASAALANDIETNPSGAQSAREWQEFLGQSQKYMGNAGAGYAQEGVSQSGRKNRNH
jgi:hypothetical protein